MTIIAQFIPQTWIDGNAVDCDGLGASEWDATAFVMRNGKEAAAQIRDYRDTSDQLRDDPNAPAWIGGWGGPFAIRVEESIAAHLAALEAESETYLMTLRELATVLAALRYWQAFGSGEATDGSDYEDIATNGGEIEALNESEIDDLCERLNMGPDEDEAESEESAT